MKVQEGKTGLITLKRKAFISAILVSLMVAFFLFFCPVTVRATTDPSDTGQQDERTNIDDPGASDNADELSDLNVQNTFTITYNDGNGNQVLKIDDIAVTTKRLGFFELRSPSISSFNGYVDINQGAMRYDYTTPGGIRVISMTPEVFFLKTKTTLTYDDTTKSNTVDNAMYQFNVMPEAGTASIIVMQVVHAKDRKYFNSITAASVPYCVTPDGFTINASNLNTNAYYVLHYTDSLGTTISTTNKYPFKTFNATVNLVDDQFEANYMIGSSATATATGKAYPDYNAY